MNNKCKYFGIVTIIVVLILASCGNGTTGGSDPCSGGHNFVNGTVPATETTDGFNGEICTVCGDTGTGDIEYATGTSGLAYMLSSGRFTVRKGTVTGGVVHIPAYHRESDSSPYYPVVNIGNYADTSGNGAFQGTSITSINIIGNKLESIGLYAFRDVSSLQSINLPNSLIYITDSAFRGSGLTSITIPDSVDAIQGNAFYNCLNLASVNVPKNLTTIGNDIFSGCSNLENVTLESGLTLIGIGMFYNCGKLTSISLPGTITTIGASAFRNTGLTSITIPASVDTISDYTFQDCSSLTSVTVHRSVPPTVGYFAQYVITGTIPGSLKIYVPPASVSAYKSDWSFHADKIEAMP